MEAEQLLVVFLYKVDHFLRQVIVLDERHRGIRCFSRSLSLRHYSVRIRVPLSFRLLNGRCALHQINFTQIDKFELRHQPLLGCDQLPLILRQLDLLQPPFIVEILHIVRLRWLQNAVCLVGWGHS